MQYSAPNYNRPLRPPRLLSLTIALVASQAVQAAVPVDTASAIETTVVTATRQDAPANATTASIRAIGEEELAGVKAVHISELLARAPGTWISRGNGQEHLTAIRSPVFTGTGSCGAFYMAEDNIPLRPVGFCNVNELSESLSELASRVEVLRGPGTAVHGSNAQHGVINVISRRPEPGDRTALSLEGGPHGYARGTLSATLAGEADSVAGIDLSVTHDDGWKDASGLDQFKGALSWRGELAGNGVQTRLVYGVLDQETAGYIEGKDAYKDDSVRERNPNPEAFRDNEYLRWYARVDGETAAGDAWSITPFLRYQEMEFLQHFLVGQPLEENGSYSGGWQSEWRPANSGPLDLTLGIDGEWADGYLKQTQEQSVAAPVFPSGKQYDYEVESLNLAAYVQGDWTLSDRLTLSGGLRAEYQEYDYDNRMINGATRDDGTPCGIPSRPIACRYSRPADRSDDFTELSWNLGARWSLNDTHQLIAGYAHGFRPPQAAELYRLQAGQLVADIDAEETDSLEFGWRGSLADLNLQLVAYYMRKQDAIFQDSQRRNVTGADTEHLGIEYSLQWALSDTWRVLADGTWARHRHTNNPEPGDAIDGNDMDTAPRVVSSTRLEWRPLETVRAELEWSHLDDYYLTSTETQRYPGHDLLHLRVTHTLSERLNYAVRVTNLSDEAYAERADFAFGSYRYFVGEPRGVYIELGLAL